MAKPTRTRHWHVWHALALLLVLLSMVVAGGASAATPAIVGPQNVVQGHVLIGGDPLMPAVGALVVATQDGLPPVATTVLASTGEYSLNLGAGDWQVNVAPPPASTVSPTWVYTAGAQLASFSGNPGPESPITLAFHAAAAGVMITGQVKDPSGLTNFAAPNRVWVRAVNQEGQGNTVQVNTTTGAFSLNVLPGNTLIRLGIENPQWAPPPTLAGSVFPADSSTPTNAPPTLNPLQLVAKTGQISGVVRDQANAPITGAASADIRVRAWRFDGSEIAEAPVSPADGSYSMQVVTGTWQIRAVPLATSAYVTAQSPRWVRLTDAQPIVTGKDLKVALADVTVNGTIVDGNNALISTASGRAYALYTDSDGVQLGPEATIMNGAFTLKLASSVASTYKVRAFFPQKVALTALADATVKVADGATQTKTIPAAPDNSTISGHFNRHDTGAPQTGLAGIVYAASNSAGWARALLNPLDGSYSMKVATTNTSGNGGSFWRLRGFVDPTSGYVVQHPRRQWVFIPDNNGTGGSATANFTVAKIDAAIAGCVTDAQGHAVAGARVSVREQDATTDEPFDRWDLTGALGCYRIRVPAGIYKVRADFRQLIAPEPKIITVASGATAVANLQFRAKDAFITGQVSYNGAPQTAFIRAYSDTGAHVDTLAGADGHYRLGVNTGDTWRVQAVSEVTTTLALTPTLFLRSNRIAITPHVSPPPNQLNLILQPSSALPDGLAFTFDAAVDQVLTLSDLSQLIIPAGALAPGGQVAVVVRPLPELADNGGTQPVSFGYRVLGFDASHIPITHFNTSVTIALPFSAAQLAALGVTADQLVPSYWDEATSSWKPVPNETVVTDATGGGTVNIQVDHFTDFALMAPTDQHTIFLPLMTH